jgi:ABC-type uncharacterized transport system involved in gliding motility auxiliary subunit
MNRQTLSSTGLLLAAVLFLAAVIVSNALLTGLRIDLTSAQLYTLSEGSRRVLASIDEPIRLRLYYSSKLFADVPQIATYGDRVRDLLKEYVQAADGKLDLTLVDPEPFSETEDQAVAAGVQQIPIGQAGEMGYFGLVGTNSTDDEVVIPVFQPGREATLEYEISRLVHGLAHPVKRKIGVISWLPQFDQGGGAALMNLLAEGYDVTWLPKDTRTIGADIDTLVVVHPKDVGQLTRYAIDQFVLRGGRAMVFVDPLSEEDPVQPDPKQPLILPSRSSNLPEILAKWGLSLDTSKIVTDAAHAIRVQYAGSRGPQEVEFLPWIAVDRDGLSTEDFATSQLSRVHVGNAGELVVDPNAGTTVIPLVSTGPQSMLLESDAVIFQRDPAKLLSLYKPEDIRRHIAVRVTGPVASAFPEGRPKVESLMDDDPDFLAESRGPVNVLVVADTDILSDRFWVRFQKTPAGSTVPTPIADNASFFINVLDQLGGSEDLISLRSRAVYARPFTRVEAIRREAEARFRDEERALEARLAETEQRIMALQSEQQEGMGELLLTPEQKSELDRFREEQLRTRRELRNVQRELQRNIDQLGNTLKFINIGLVPLIIAMIAVMSAISRTLVRRRARAA